MKDYVQKFKRFCLIFSARIAGAGALFAANLLIARELGFENLATYAVFVSFVSIGAVIVSSGFPAVAPIFVTEYSTLDKPGYIKGFARKALGQGAKLCFLLSAIFICLWTLNLDTSLFARIDVVIAIMIAIYATALLSLNGSVLVGMKKQVAGLLPETFIRPVIFLAFLTAFLWFGNSNEIDVVLWLITGSLLVTCGIVALRDRNIYKRITSEETCSENTRWKSAAYPWMGISLLWDFMIDLVILLVSIMASSIELAILHICFRYRVLAGFGMRTIHTLMMPEITQDCVKKDKQKLQSNILLLNSVSLVYSLAVLLAFALFGSYALAIFSPEAASSVPVLLLVTSTMIIRAAFGPGPLLLAIHGLHKYTLISSIIGLSLGGAFILTTYDTIGIISAAIGYTGANLIISASLWILAKRKTGIDTSIFGGISRRLKSSKNSPVPSAG